MKFLSLIIPVLIFPCFTRAQKETDSLNKMFLAESIQQDASLIHPEKLLRFYDQLQYKTVWINDSLLSRQLFSRIRNAAQYGLNTTQYETRLRELEEYKGNDKVNPFVWDLKITDLGISFVTDFIFGNPPPVVGYTGITVKQDCFDIPLLLSAAVTSGNIEHFLDSIDSRSIVYLALKKEMENLASQPDSFNQFQYQSLYSAINAVRWLNCLQKNGKTIVVNIPSATLQVFEHDSVLLASNVITGKPSTPTPTLISEVTRVVLYPYWMVPHKIASRELLPLIKKHPGYLQENNFQVLNSAGRIITPSSIDWQALSAGYFPYTLRQSTGCDNSLGIIKLEFYSPYSVYLHDTPWKPLFLAPQRFFSHGCIRVEKAISLARLLLENNTIAIDSLINHQPPATHSSVYIKLPSPIPVIVLYNTAWPDSAGVIHYYKDVYDKLKFRKKQ